MFAFVQLATPLLLTLQPENRSHGVVVRNNNRTFIPANLTGRSPMRVSIPHTSSGYTMTIANGNMVPSGAPFDLESMISDISQKASEMPSDEDEVSSMEEQKKFSNHISKQLEDVERLSGLPVAKKNKENNTSDNETILNTLVSETHGLKPSDLFDDDDTLSQIFPTIEKQFKKENDFNNFQSKEIDDNIYVHDHHESMNNISTEEKSRKHQADPRMASAEKMKAAKESIQRRRVQLAAERGENDLQIYEKDENVSELEHEALKESKRTLIVNSVRGSYPFCEHTSVPTTKQNELISMIPSYVEMNARAPSSYRPFLAIGEALHRTQYEQCPRCGKLEYIEMLKNRVGLCKDCYNQIYLSGPPIPQVSRLVDTFDKKSPLEGRSELKEDEEKQLAQQAENIVRDLSVLNQKNENIMSNAKSTVDPVSVNVEEKNSFFDDPVEIGKEVKVPKMKADGSSTAGNVSKKIGTNGSAVVNGSGNRKDDYGNGNGNGNGNLSELDDNVDGWQVVASDRAKRTINPIRNLVQNITVKPNPDKELIKLSVGDPTVYGNLRVSEVIVDAYVDALREGSANGYAHSLGTVEARTAVAEKYSSTNSPLTVDDVILTGGASGALELVLGAIANEGDNILLPQPGFPLFRTLAEGLGIECRYYRLRPHDGWKTELSDFGTLADERTRAILVNNPSNPCGSVFSRSHMESILSIASALRVPIVTDEVYADMVFGSTTFSAFGTISTDVPVLAVGAVSKQCVVPGWRLGWVLIHDRGNILKDAGVIQGMRQLTTRMMVANTPAQMALPQMMKDHEGFEAIMDVLQENAKFAMNQLKDVKGLKCIKPSGAMYMMVMVDVKKLGLKDDMEFVEKLLQEEAVFALPGQCFQAENFIRIVFSAPKSVLKEAFARMDAFCKRRIRQE